MFLLLDTFSKNSQSCDGDVGDVGVVEHEEQIDKNPGHRGARSSPHNTKISAMIHEE